MGAFCTESGATERPVSTVSTRNSYAQGRQGGLTDPSSVLASCTTPPRVYRKSGPLYDLTNSLAGIYHTKLTHTGTTLTEILVEFGAGTARAASSIQMGGRTLLSTRRCYKSSTSSQRCQVGHIVISIRLVLCVLRKKLATLLFFLGPSLLNTEASVVADRAARDLFVRCPAWARDPNRTAQN